jgi:hypothetical protein
LEGLTDYLSLQSTKNIIRKTTYEKIIDKYIGEVRNFEVAPINSITDANQISEKYRYNYVPLLLTAIEKELGEKDMWNWIRQVINSENEVTDYDFFINTLRDAGIDDKKIESIESLYISSERAKQNVLSKLR